MLAGCILNHQWILKIFYKAMGTGEGHQQKQRCENRHHQFRAEEKQLPRRIFFPRGGGALVVSTPLPMAEMRKMRKMTRVSRVMHTLAATGMDSPLRLREVIMGRIATMRPGTSANGVAL